MTASTVPPRPAGPQPGDRAAAPEPAPGAPRAVPARSSRRRRWHRIAIPFAVTALVFTVTGVTHAIDQPDPTEPGFLSPVDTGPDGGSQLAEALRADGVTVQRVRRTPDGLAAAQAATDVTLFVPAPSQVDPGYLPILTNWTGLGRVVLVDPPDPVLRGAGVPVTRTDRRWATRAVAPDAAGEPCGLPEAQAAGPAAALLQRYAVSPRYGSPAPPSRCYQDGLVRMRWLYTEIVVIGSSDPFRNDRIDEHRNAELAKGLLASRGKVIWLDLDTPEPPPVPVTGRPTGVPNDPYHVQPGDGPPQGSGEGRPGSGEGRPGQGDSESEEDDQQSRAGDEENPLWGAFPPWFWALLVQLAVALLVIVLWRARRLGPPVSEPLPVRVVAAETVLGRGRLYQRAKARGPTADVLRAAARNRLLPALNLSPESSPDDVAAAVVARTGWTAPAARNLLYGPEPDSDDELLRLARDLDRLIHRTSGPVPHAGSGDRPSEGDDR